MYNLLVLLGPTASGKTALAARLAATLDGEVISGDSRQVYRGMDIGTGKDLGDYIVDGKRVPCHLVDIRDPGYKYNVHEYQRDFFEVFSSLRSKGRWPVLCGGSGMYIEAVLQHFKLVHVPVNQALRKSLGGKSLGELESILKGMRLLHNTTDTDTIKRAIRAIEIETYYNSNPHLDIELPEVKPLVVGLNLDRETRRANISERLANRLRSGMIEEVQSLLDKGIAPPDLIYYGLEYKYVTRYLLGELSYDEMRGQLEIAIHQFAKRQMTWFRGMERRGITIHWVDAHLPLDVKLESISRLLG